MNANWLYHLNKGFWVGLDWLFPPVCGGCESPGMRWCQECQNKIQKIYDPVCDACGLPQAHFGLCARCQKIHPAFLHLRSWAVFEGPMQGALHRLKYRRDIGLGEALSNQLAGFVESLKWLVDMLLPIPLGKERLKERGYNQVAMIARPLSIQLGVDYYPNALVRARETRSQVGLSASERKENVRDAFVAVEKHVNARSVLLMDDVSTTGATLSSATEGLYNSGAHVLYAITIARALPHHNLKIV